MPMSRNEDHLLQALDERDAQIEADDLKITQARAEIKRLNDLIDGLRDALGASQRRQLEVLHQRDQARRLSTTHLPCPNPLGMGSTHHLVPISGLMTCAGCEKTEAQIWDELGD